MSAEKLCRILSETAVECGVDDVSKVKESNSKWRTLKVIGGCPVGPVHGFPGADILCEVSEKIIFAEICR
jgi:hypothetical protein